MHFIFFLLTDIIVSIVSDFIHLISLLFKSTLLFGLALSEMGLAIEYHSMNL